MEEMTEVELAAIELSYSSVSPTDGALYHTWHKHVQPLIEQYRRERTRRLFLEQILKDMESPTEELNELVSRADDK